MVKFGHHGGLVLRLLEVVATWRRLRHLDARVARVVRREGSLLVGARLGLLHRADLLGGEFVRELVLRHDTLLVQRVINGLRGAKTMCITISTLLFLVDVLAQARLLLSRKLVLVPLRRSHASRDTAR